jgi:hypothetical protein
MLTISQSQLNWATDRYGVTLKRPYLVVLYDKLWRRRTINSVAAES